MHAERCQGRAESFLGTCDRKPTVFADGRGYCWQHDPARKRAIARKRWEKQKAKIVALEAKFDAEIERKKLLDASGVSRLTNGDLEKIIAYGGIAEILSDLHIA